jgi:putative ABC transport system permease protein
MVEFSLLGGVAGLLALLGSEAICYGLYTALLDIPYGGLGWLWLWLLPATMLVLVALGTLLMRRAVTVAPLRVLRELD